MTATSVLATFLCTTLPETLNKPTKETLDDMVVVEAVTLDTELPPVTDFDVTSRNSTAGLVFDVDVMDDENVVSFVPTSAR